MAAGYDPGLFVWATDRHALRAGPVHRDLIAEFPDRYDTDEQHPVVDHRGILLESKPVRPITDPIPTPQPAKNTTKE